jgi:hypothetical protein
MCKLPSGVEASPLMNLNWLCTARLLFALKQLQLDSWQLHFESFPAKRLIRPSVPTTEIRLIRRESDSPM